MKKIFCFCALVALAACEHVSADVEANGLEADACGRVSVVVKQEQLQTKALTDYTTALDNEMLVNDVAVFVFDKATGVLNAYKYMLSLDSECEFNVTTGDKIVYAVVNGPDMGEVTTVTQLEQVVNSLDGYGIEMDGLAMVGKQECKVEAGKVMEPVVIVKRMVSRVVLRKVTNKVAPQYGTITIKSIFLGDANTCQTISGQVYGTVNPGGYADDAKTKPIGKNGVTGSCYRYLYKNVNASIVNGSEETAKHHLYCHPSGAGTLTCLYILAAIGGSEYYYRVPLANGLAANTTCSVEVEIVNLGSALPPDGDIQKGEIMATVSIAGWDAGDNYVVKF